MEGGPEGEDALPLGTLRQRFKHGRPLEQRFNFEQEAGEDGDCLPDLLCWEELPWVAQKCGDEAPLLHVGCR
jgi:hypothetical protein